MSVPFSIYRTRCPWILLSLLGGIGLASGSHANGPRKETEATAGQASRPNVVLILTDNHGAWTLGCYGNSEIATPNIDRLAREGTLLTRAFANNPVCSPTRASLLTGLMPSQHGVHCFLFSGRLQTGPEARCTLDAFRSLPEILKDAGYACGLVGKWHLGGNLKPQEGLDDYWITMPHGATSTFYGARIIENGEIRTEPTYLTDFWTDHACRFIRQQAGTSKPFFLFLSYNGPYALGSLLLKEGKNRHAARYADAPLASFPREPAHPWQYNNRDYINNPVAIRRVATEVSGIDDGVGRILATLKETGAAENTLILFLADQGWVGGHGGFFGMGDHTRPFTARDGMMQIPMIWWHPGQIASQRSDLMVSNIDVLPTLLSYLGMKDAMPVSPPSPGRDFSALLRGETMAGWESEVFFEFETLRCIRTDRWKLVKRYPEGPNELYDLLHDPGEEHNRIDDPAVETRRRELEGRLEAFFRRYADPKYDLWKGGGSQTRLLSAMDPVLVRGKQDSAPEGTGRATSSSPASRPQTNAQAAGDARPSEEADFTPPSVRVPEGFQVELAAAPPLVAHPTMATLDDRGRLFVCENAGVNLSAQELEAQLPNSIRLLTDTDGDGRYDHSTVFADRMTFPMGAVWYRGALYVASPPYIWKLEDTDDDGVADRRTILVSKFGYTGNAASIHGCFLGPDGRLYWCDGYHGHEFNKEGDKVTREGSYLFSCLPDGSDVRIHCGGGMDNPVEVDFWPSGEMLGTVNILYTRPRVDCMVHWLYGGTYPHRERILKERPVTGDFLGPIHRFGHVAVSGTTRYRSGILDRHWQSSFFVTFFNSGKVVRLDVQRKGSTFAAKQFEFLSSPSRDFHPTDVLEDADGSLLVVDTGGWFYRGCPTSQLAKPEIRGAIYRIRRPGAPRQIDPYGRRIDWKNMTVAQAVTLLGDTRHRVRARAVEATATHGPAAIPALTRALKTRDRRWRLGAVWSLCRIANDHLREDAVVVRVLEALKPALADRDLDVRLAALHVFGLHPRPEFRSAMESLLKDAEPAVRRRAAVALGRMQRAESVPALLAAVDRAADREEEHALLYALLEINAPRVTAAGLRSDSSRIRRAALIALDQQAHPEAQKGLTLKILLDCMEDRDERLAATALDILNRRKDRYDIDAVVKRLDGWLAAASSRQEKANLLNRFLATWIGNASVASWVASRLESPDLSPELRQRLLSDISSRQAPSLPAVVVGPVVALLASSDSQLRELAAVALRGVRDEAARKELRQLVLNEDASVSLRLSALESLAAGSARLDPDVFEWILDMLGEGASPSARLRLVQVLGRAALTNDQLLAMTEILEEAGPLELAELIRPYQRTKNAEVGKAFLEALESARSLESLSENDVSRVVLRYPRELLPRANRLMAKLRSLQQEKADSVARYLKLVSQADVSRGQKVFFSERAKCSTCHRIGKEGGDIGPDLTTIGANRSPEDLLESILFPSATIVRQYEPYVVRLKDGRVLNGLIARETNDSITLQPQTGDPLVIPRNQIDALQMSTVSVMPAGLEKELTPEQLADVVRFLLSCKRDPNVAESDASGDRKRGAGG